MPSGCIGPVRICGGIHPAERRKLYGAFVAKRYILHYNGYKEAIGMDLDKVGGLLRTLRREKGLTQRALAEQLGVSDRTISKWETGRGAPDISLLSAVSDALGINIEGILCGELRAEDCTGGNMKKTRYYYCPVCGSLSLSTGSAAVSCCGRPLSPLEPAAPDPEHALTIEPVEDEWYISSEHPMIRGHFITFAAMVTSDRIQLIKQYPEWNFQLRLPRRAGLLLWHCSEHGLFSMPLKRA